MSSWQAYVDRNLLGSGKVQRAAIYGQDGSCWAASCDFSITEKEVVELVKSLKDGSVSSKTIAGIKYLMLRNNKDTGTTYLRLKEKGGFCVCLTKKALLIGGYDEAPGGAGNCNTVVEGLATYLKDSGY